MHYRPTVRQLSFLIALYRHGHFGKAAEALNVTQSTLSAGIQELENLLGAPLVERTRRLVRFTRLGTEVVKRAETIIAETDDLVNLVKAAGAPLSGEVRLGAIPTIGPFVLPKVLPLLKKKYPDLRLFLREGQTEDTLGFLQKGDLDAALIAYPYPTQGLDHELVSEDAFRLVCSKTHPFAGRSSISLSDLDEKELLLLEEGHCLREHALDFCRVHKLKAPEQFKATSLETLILMVAEGLGITLVPEIAVSAGLLKGKNLAVVTLEGSGAGRQIGLTWRSSNPRGAQFQLLAAELKTLLIPA